MVFWSLEAVLTSAAVGKAKLNRLLHCPEGVEVCQTHAAQSNRGVDTQTEAGKRGDSRMGSNLLGCTLQKVLLVQAQAARRQNWPCSAAAKHVLMVDMVLCELRELLAAPGTECGQ